MNSTVVRIIRIVVLVGVVVALSIACSIFFAETEKPTAQDGRNGVKIARANITVSKPPDDASRQPVRQEPGLGKKPPPKPIETDFAGQQPKRQAERSSPRARDKPQTDNNASSLTDAKFSAVEQRIAKKYDQMFDDKSSKVFQDPLAAAHSLVEKEAVDQTWAPEASQLLADSFSDLSGSLDISVINCRTNICEMRINSWPGENYSDINLVGDRLNLIKQQPWFKQYFDETAAWSAFLEDGLPLTVIYFSRK